MLRYPARKGRAICQKQPMGGPGEAFPHSGSANSPAVTEAGGVLNPWNKLKARGKPGLHRLRAHSLRVPGILGS